jgi:hypothetical protein
MCWKHPRLTHSPVNHIFALQIVELDVALGVFGVEIKQSFSCSTNLEVLRVHVVHGLLKHLEEFIAIAGRSL